MYNTEFEVWRSNVRSVRVEIRRGGLLPKWSLVFRPFVEDWY